MKLTHIVGLTLALTVIALGATLAYYRNLTDHLEATAALGIDSISRPDPLPGQTNLSALAGLRYTF